MNWSFIAVDLAEEDLAYNIKTLNAISAKVDKGLFFIDAAKELLEEDPTSHIYVLAALCARGADVPCKEADNLCLCFKLAEERIVKEEKIPCLSGGLLNILDKAYQKLGECAHLISS